MPMTSVSIVPLETILESINAWRVLLVSFDHKKKPNEFVCHSFAFAETEERNNTVRRMLEAFLKNVNHGEDGIAEYTGMNPRGSADYLHTRSELISESWSALVASISIADDDTPISDVKARAYLFVGTYNGEDEDENVYFIKCKDPMISMKKVRGFKKIYAARGNSIVEIPEPLIQFGGSFDAIVFRGVLYMINGNCETLFNMEYSRKRNCRAKLVEVRQANIVEDIELYERFALSGHNSYMFLTFDPELLGFIKSTEGRELLNNEFKISSNPETGRYSLSEPEKAKLFPKIICGKAKKELAERAFCEVASSKRIIIR